MFFDPENVPGIGRLMLISMKPSEDFRKEHDEMFKEVEDLSRIYCAVSSELSDVYRIWNIYGQSYTKKNTVSVTSEEREVPVDLLALWTEVLILRTIRLTDKFNKSVSICQFSKLNLDDDLKEKVENLIEITKAKTDLFKSVRDQFIAHKDFTALEGGPLLAEPGFTIYDVADALEAIGDILICILNHYVDDSTDIFFDGPSGFGGTLPKIKY